MAVLYPMLWAQRCGDSPQKDDGELTIAGEVWRDLLSGLTGEQVLTGLQRCVLRPSEFPPAPQEFRALAMGVPLFSEVRMLMRDADAMKPPFIALVYQHLDYYNWRQSDQRTADRMLRDAYDAARDHVMLGGALPKPVAALESPEQRKPVPASPEVAAAHIATIRDELGVPAALTGKDAAAGPDA